MRRQQEKTMPIKKIKPQDNRSNMPNPNKGMPGTNKQYDQNQGNRGRQNIANQSRGQKKGK